jgi:hypothetical protein
MALELDPNQVFRDFVTDRIPSSGAWNPRKVEIRALLTEWWQTLIALVADKGGLELPNLLISMTVTGGDENAIVAEANLPVPSGPGIAIFSIDIEETNTGPVTINGKPLLSNGGKSLVAGALAKDGIYLFLDNGPSYRLLSDYTSASIIAAAEAAAEQAEAAAERAETAAAGVKFPVSYGLAQTLTNAQKKQARANMGVGERHDLGTALDIRAFEADPNVQFIRTAGRTAPGDGGSAVFRRVKSEPTHAGKFQSADGAWWEIADIFLNFEQFGAAGDGETDDTIAINNCLATAKAINRPWVRLGQARTYLYRGSITVPEGVLIEGEKTATLRRASGSSAEIAMGDNTTLRGMRLDGNRSANADSSNFVQVRVGISRDVTIDNCEIFASSGYCIVNNSGPRTIVTRCRIYDYYQIAIAFYGSLGFLAGHIVSDNFITGIGVGAVIVQTVVGARIVNNNISGLLVGGRDRRMTVNTEGSTVTHVSGPDFSNAKPGNFLVVNGGREFRILDVTSNTSMTVEGTLPTLSDAQASYGSGDLIGLISCQDVSVEGNLINYTATYGMGCSTMGLDASNGNILFQNNSIRFAGKNAISVSKEHPGKGQTVLVSVLGNMILNAGYAGGVAPNDRAAIILQSPVAGALSGVLLDGNSGVSYDGEGQTMQLVLRTGEVREGDRVMGANLAVGMASGLGG